MTNNIRGKVEERGGKGEPWSLHKLSPLIFYNGCRYIGGVEAFEQFAKAAYDFRVDLNAVLAQRKATVQFREYLERPVNIEGSKRKHVYLDFTVTKEDGGAETDKVIIELYTDICPKTCENFYQLCTGEKG